MEQEFIITGLHIYIGVVIFIIAAWFGARVANFVAQRYVGPMIEERYEEIEELTIKLNELKLENYYMREKITKLEKEMAL